MKDGELQYDQLMNDPVKFQIEIVNHKIMEYVS